MDLVDDDGTNTAATFQVLVLDVKPTVAFSGATSVDEGSHYTITVGPVFDPGADVITRLTIHWGDGSPNTFAQIPGDVTHTYADGTTNPTITVDVLDDYGLHVTAGSFPLTVNNVAPTLSLGGVESIDEGSVYTLTLGTVVDPGVDEVTRCKIRWGGRTTEQLPHGKWHRHSVAKQPSSHPSLSRWVGNPGRHDHHGRCV